MLQFLGFILDQTATSDTWNKPDTIAFWSCIGTALSAAAAIAAYFFARSTAEDARKLAKEMAEKEAPNLSLDAVSFECEPLGHTCILECTVSNRSRLPDAIMSSAVELMGVDIKPFTERWIFICNRPGETFQASLQNLKQWPHVYPVKVDFLSSTTFKLWFVAPNLGAQRFYRPEVGPVQLKVTMQTLRGQTLVKQKVFSEMDLKSLEK